MPSPFQWCPGTVQLFITLRDSGLFVAASSPEYDRNKPVGTAWEREVVKAACTSLNRQWNEGKRDFTETNVKEAVRFAEKTTPFK